MLLQPLRYWCLLVGLLALAPKCFLQEEDIPHNEVKNWALKFGVNLWIHGSHITKRNDILSKYKGASFKKKDGFLLARDLAAEIKNLMDMKKNAVLRIMDAAEEVALSRASDEKRIRVEGCDGLKEIGPREQPADHREMAFKKNRHFAFQRVNTSYGCLLHSTASASSEESKIRNDIRWIQELDAIFRTNYEIDPFLGWQSFGTPTGILFRYPAIKRSADDFLGQQTDEFRSDSWFVEAIASPKDVVVLLDTSAALSDATRRLAHLTVKTVLDTLNENDFLNIYSLDEADRFLVPCFKDLLVQGADRNKRKLLRAVKSFKSSNRVNITGALAAAFEILHKYNRSGRGSQCNQAIVLIVDDKVNSDFEDVFKEYNWPHKPVRVFAYSIAGGKSKESELKTIACNNKGYYEHVRRPEEIGEKVLNYLLVMARPLVMYENDHLIHWSSVYVDRKDSVYADLDGRLVITVSAAAFDKRKHAERTANVLGVAAADLPVREIKKLAPPYKLGANGYSFLINNNGHVIYHPDLRAPYAGSLRPSHLAVDLTDVEFLDPYSQVENNSVLYVLRQQMIDHKEGETDFRSKKHFDSMRRVSFRTYKYFFHPIYDTPFSLGIALPTDYGMYEIVAEEEVKLSSANVSDFFRGKNWTVHPDWVYCEYHYPEYRDFDTAEEQVVHFLNRATQPAWKWKSVRPRPLDQNVYLGEEPRNREFGSYFCDKNLLQSLIFDAKITQEFQSPSSSYSSNKHDNQHGHDQFGVTLTFVATRSGLLRWRDFSLPPEYLSRPHFSQTNRRAIDETWYKRAVDHHEIDRDSFVYSIPFSSGGNVNPPVTATHAIFVENQGYKAPVAVVGVQFQYKTLAAHFLNITAACTNGMGCKKTCSSDDLDCYVLDDNGFVIISEKSEHAGQFFGEIDGTIMDSLVQDGIYKKVSVHDHQASCEDTLAPIYDSASVIAPLKSLWSTTYWLLTHLLWLLSELTCYRLLVAVDSVRNEQLENENPIYSDDYENGVDEMSIVDDSNNVDADADADANAAVADDKSTSEWRTENGAGVGATSARPSDAGATARTPPTASAADAARSTAVPATADADAPEADAPSPPPLYVPSPHKIRRAQLIDNVKLRTCAKKVSLFVLQAARLNNSGQSNPLKGKLTNCHATGCERPFSVQKIPHSNLMLLVVDTLCPCGSKQLNISPREVIDGKECDLKYEFAYRRRTGKCVNYHPETRTDTILVTPSSALCAADSNAASSGGTLSRLAFAETEILQCGMASRPQSGFAAAAVSLFGLRFLLFVFSR